MLKQYEISELIKQKIEQFNFIPDIENEGIILSFKDNIAQISGLSEAMLGEVVLFKDGTRGIIMNLHQDFVEVIIIGNKNDLQESQTVIGTKQLLSVPVGYELLGRVVNALGETIDGLPKIKSSIFYSIEREAPAVINRQSINIPLETGIKLIDSMIPIGRGQRELIIGDRQTGKTSIAIDIIINQKNNDVKCIYVAIGQKSSSVVNLKSKLEKYGAMKNTVILSASAAESATEQYIAVYSGCAIGEYFRDQGEDVIIIYDDLTKHAWAYRQLSLLLKRPPGREAYPGDIFYLHSRLLERSAFVNKEYINKISNGKINKTGSLTAFPIVETQSGDLSSFIPTNIISITDGQIFLETDLFNAGIRPAINIGLSVSRIGNIAQTPIIKKLSEGLRLTLAQYREIESFAQFVTELDDITQKQLIHGQQAIEILKQDRYQPLNMERIALNLFLIKRNELLNNIQINKIKIFECQLYQYIQDNHDKILNQINLNRIYSSNLEISLIKIINDFKNIFLEAQ